VNATAPVPDATPIRLNVDVFVAECASRGALNDSARGELFGVDRGTVWRWRHGRQVPSLDLIARMASVFEVPVERLLDQVAA
jgi:DNA-binding XRE family transcriptional regulator